jgi:ribonuclease HI
MSKLITIYSDGSCVNSTGEKGGYGIVFINGSIRTFSGGSYSNTTSARMELLGAIRGLQKCKVGDRVELWCDNQYVVNTIEKGWLFKWSLEKFSNRKNSDLLKMLLNEYIRLERKVKFKWLRGHDNNNGNEVADLLARMGANSDKIIFDDRELTE